MYKIYVHVYLVYNMLCINKICIVYIATYILLYACLLICDYCLFY